MYAGRFNNNSKFFSSVQYHSHLVRSTRVIEGMTPGIPWNMYSGVEHVMKAPMKDIHSSSSRALSSIHRGIDIDDRYDMAPTAPPQRILHTPTPEVLQFATEGRAGSGKVCWD
jgi:hypothetical protein